MADLLPRALEFARARPADADPTPGGLLASALSHLPHGGHADGDDVGGAGEAGGVCSREEASAALARGLGAHLAPPDRLELASQLAR
jgi:hypothetical protein